MLRHMDVRWTWAAVALLLVGCTEGRPETDFDAAGSPTAAPSAAATPSATPAVATAAIEPLPTPARPQDSGFTGDARVVGVLGGDRASGCLWLRRASNENPIPLKVLTPVDHPMLVDFSSTPFVLRSGGQVITEEGDWVTLIGFYGGDVDVPVAGCPVIGTPFKGQLVIE